MSDFYITLPSNVGGAENKTSDFGTRLPEPILFRNNWSVGLHEILISGEILTVPRNVPFVITLRDGGGTINCHLPKGTYKTPQALAAALNNAVPRTRKRRNAPVEEEEIPFIDEDEEAQFTDIGDPNWTAEEWAEHYARVAARNNSATDGPTAQPKEVDKKILPTDYPPPPSKTKQEADAEIETKKKKELEAQAAAEAVRLAEEKKKQEEENRKIEKAKQDEKKRREEEEERLRKQKKEEEERKRKEEEHAALETKQRKEEEKKKQTQAREQQERTEKKRKEDEARKREEKRRKEVAEAERIRKANEDKIVKEKEAAERKKKEDEIKEKETAERKKKEDELKAKEQREKKEADEKRKEAERKKKEEQAMKDAEEAKKRAADEAEKARIKGLEDARLERLNQADQQVQTGPIVSISEQEEELFTDSYATSQLPTHIAFIYEERSGKMIVNFNYNVQQVDFSDEISYMCGFSQHTLYDSAIGEHSPDCTNGKSLLYVYSDVCAFSVCGTQKTNLLRVIPCMNAQNDTVSQSFQQIRYIRVRSEYVDSIRIQILDSLGNEVAIQGYICVVLHITKDA